MGDPADGPRALRQKEQKAIKKKKVNKVKIWKMDSSNSESNNTNNNGKNCESKSSSVENVKLTSNLTDVLSASHYQQRGVLPNGSTAC
jgi:hypothetical protein